MTAYIGCFGLLAIAVFIALLFVRRKKIENEMTEFYKAHSLYVTTDEPPNVRESLDAASDNLYCCRTNLTTEAGERVEYCWWEWYIKSNTVINGVPTASFNQYLAASFAPKSVGYEFVQKALQSADKSGDDFSQKAKDFFVNNSDKPYRAEILADGSLIICWRTGTKQRAVYEAKIAWLKNNVAPPSSSEITTPEKAKDIMPDEPKMIQIVAPDESNIAGTIFYTHETYATLCQKFNAAWTNLELELNHWSAVFQHEGRDEFGGDKTFGDPDRANEIAFVLTDETSVEKARQMFSETYGGAAYILRGGSTVKDDESLAACNNSSNSEN